MKKSQGDHHLSFFCKDQSSFRAKFGAITLYKAHFPAWLEKFLLIFEYLQLFSLTILLHPNIFLLSGTNPENTLIFEAVVYFFQMVNPTYLLTFDRSDPTTNCVLAIIFASVVFKYLILFYIVYVTSFNTEPNPILKTLWRWTVKLQGRVACCFVTSFWVRTIVNTSNDSFGIGNLGSQAVISIAALLIASEYIVSFLLETQLCDFIPTNRCLSSKNYDMQVITLIQKLMIQFTQIFVSKSVEGSIWICIALNFLLGWIRGFRFFTTLPLYNYDSLMFQGDLIAALFSLNLVHFFHQLLRQANYSQETDFRFILVIWIVIGILSVRLSRAYLKQTYLQLLTQSHPKGNPDLLLHKIFATQHLIRNTTLSNKRSEKNDINHLLGVTQTLNLSQVFNLKPRNISYDLIANDEEDTSRIILEYLEKLNSQFPKNSLIKLNLAYQHFQSNKFHSKIIKITSKLNESLLSPYYMSSTLLLYDLELSTIAEFNTVEEKKKLDLINYMDQQIFMQNFENEVLKQITLRKQICESIIGEKPDLETIYQNSQTLHRSKMLIQKRISSFLKQAPAYFLHPLLVFAEYSLYLNYSIEDYHHYYENYSRKMSKFTKEFEVNHLSEENLYQDENVFLVISADKVENNCILYSTKSLQDICGLDRNNYIGTPFTRLFPYGLRNYYDKILKEIFEKGHTEFTNKGIPALLSHKEGWLVKADIFIRVHPYMSRNFYLDMLIRPHRTFNDAIILSRNGNVEGATKSVAEFLGINNNSTLHIKEISEKLAKLNSTLNGGKNQQQEGLDDQESSSENKIIELSPPNTIGNSVKGSLKCLVLSTDCTTFPLNLIRLQTVSYNDGKLLNNSISCESILNENLQEGEQINDLPTSNRFWNLPATVKDNHEVTTSEEPAIPIRTNHETEDYLMSPSSSRFFLKSSFVTANKHQQQKHQAVTFNTDHQIPPTSPRITTTDNRSPPPVDNPAGSKVTASTHETSGKTSHISGVFKAFQQAINTKSYQKSFSLLCMTFYGVILITLILEIVLKNVLDNTMDQLITKTNLLNYAQRRNVHASIIHNTARGCVLTIGGLLTQADMNLADTPLRNNLANMVVSLDAISESNEGIMNNLSSESDEVKAMLFKDDIKIQGNFADSTDSSTELITNFQHADILANVVAYLGSLDLIASAQGAQAFTFVTHNTVNDFLVKNQEITNVFQESVDKQKESLQTLINLIVILLPILLAGVVCLLAVIIWKQYTVQKRHLLAFLKLSPMMVQKILENLRSFERKLVEQEKLQEHIAPQQLYRLERNTEFSNYHKGHNSIRSGRIQRRYILYIFQVLFYIALLIAIVIINYVCISHAIKEIYNKQRQLQYANYISSTVSVTYNAFTESFATNNTNYVKGQPPFEVFKQGITAVGEIQTNIYSEFELEDGDYDPDVKAILFEEVNCDRFVTAGYDHCISLKSLGLPNKMVSLITLYKNMLDEKLAKYNAVSKSSLGAMIGAAVERLSYILAPYRVSASEGQMINDIISEKLTQSVDDLYDLGTSILVIFSLTLVAVSALIWFQILTKVREVNNDFKKVLAVLPPNIILSSFLLKSFLNKTSNVTQKL